MLKTRNTIGGFILLGLLFMTACTKNDSLSTSPKAADADKFIATYICTEIQQGSPPSSPVSYTTSISKIDSVNVSINNFNNLKVAAKALVSGSVLTIPSQKQNGFTFNGNGSLSGNKIIMSYSVDDGQTSPIPTFSATYTKQ